VAEAIKCWKNTHGVRECGNVVPPEYAQHGYEILNEWGVVIKRITPAKTKDQIEDEARQAKIREEQEREAAIQANYDRALLSTYTSVDDMNMARDGKVRAVDTTIKLIQNKIDGLKETLAELRSRAAAMERAGNAVPGKLSQEIASTQVQIDDNLKLIEQKRQEQQAIRRKFEADILRFKLLHGDTTTAGQ